MHPSVAQSIITKVPPHTHIVAMDEREQRLCYSPRKQAENSQFEAFLNLNKKTYTPLSPRTPAPPTSTQHDPGVDNESLVFSNKERGEKDKLC